MLLYYAYSRLKLQNMSDCFPYLPVDPRCVSDLSGDPCKDPFRTSDNLAYKGPNLPCTGINNCDTLSTALQKIEAKLCELITTTTT